MNAAGEPAMRKASAADIPTLRVLIDASARALGRADYTETQISAALETAWGVDTQLIADQTYFVAEHAGALVACGGWSWRATLFGGDAQPGRIAAPLDPRVDAARIRAFFVHPSWARRGLGRRLLELCERDARARGFSAAELVATLPGVRLYAACGYRSLGAREYDLGAARTIAFVPMRKDAL